MTTKTVEETRRALFEAWGITSAWLGLGESPERDGDGYAYVETHTAWLGFNAALDAVAIELPELSKPAVDDDKAWHSIRNQTIKSCARAIESTGLGIKVI